MTELDKTKLVQHLRAAIEEVAKYEKDRTAAILNESDARLRDQVEAMRPVVAALAALRDDLAAEKEIQIKCSDDSAYATVHINANMDQTFEISVEFDNGVRSFAVHEKSYDKFGDFEGVDAVRSFRGAADALAVIVTAIGKRLGSKRAIEARRPSR